jgi:hypothetical protein
MAWSNKYERDIPAEFISKEFDHARLSPTEDWNVRFAHDIPGGHQLEETRNKKNLNMKYVLISAAGATEIVDEDILKNMNLVEGDRVYKLGAEVKVMKTIEPVPTTRGSDRETTRGSSREFKPGYRG